ncbi:hypothetical protein GQ44DRAFT_795184 [Phaeosphaeriaceae sp. PMI808]|nr:hypothetical protein GQ44DRAFT_795184 [Phaeosphaeriaceae sp. PMI808]
MYPIYSLDNTINSFFESQSTVTRRQCDELAVSLVSEPANPAPIQGAFNYTLIAGTKQSRIVQFRAQSSVLDMETLNLARAIHGRSVAACTYRGNVGQSSPLSVYMIEKLSGTTYIQARYLLSRALPFRFTENLRKIRAELPLLFTSTYPLVLSHDDLCEMNIFVDPNTGHITGIIDWAEARILTFGISLWGMTGFFLRYGFVWEDGVREIPAKELDSALRYLDAFCTTDDRTAT